MLLTAANQVNRADNFFEIQNKMVKDDLLSTQNKRRQNLRSEERKF